MNDMDYLSSLPIPQLLKIHGAILATEGKPQSDFLTANIARWFQSKRYKRVVEAKKYFKVKNNILDRKRYYIDRHGTKQEDSLLSCSKLNHAFFRKLVNQKVNYLLGKPITLKTENPKFKEVLDNFLTIEMSRKFQILAREACQTGVSWLQAYYNKKGELSYKRIPTEEIIPFWADADKTELDAVIRVYEMTLFGLEGTTQQIVKVEYYTQEGVWYYEKTKDGLVPDSSKPLGKNGHFNIITNKLDDAGNPIVDDDGNKVMQTTPANWEYIPFIPFKYTSDEVGVLSLIKNLVDNYDEITSANSDEIKDIPNNIKVVKGFDGTDAGEFTANIATYRTVFVSQDGDMTTLSNPIEFTGQEAHLSRLRKDIYEAGCGVDTQEISIGNVSGVALKFRYADLDTDIDGMILEFTRAIEQVIWFLKVDLFNTNKGDFIKEKMEVKFNKSVIINEKEQVASAADSVGIISNETIIENHPWTSNVEIEKKRLEAEESKKIQILKDLNQDGSVLTTPITQQLNKLTKQQRIKKQNTASQKDPDRGKNKKLL